MPSFDSSATDGYTHYDHSFPSNMNRYIHLFPPNPYAPLPTQPSVQQPVPHKVWIVDCKTCGAFLSNRGMRAVLLLRPNVPLFSTDALPSNTSAFTSNPEALKPPTSSRPSTLPSRSCECLTQTLCCQRCGSTIGYMIVIPCARCTSSISASNRTTNGHRFVFHSSEVVGTERHYVPGEPGVIPFESVPVAVSPPPHDSRIQYRDVYLPHAHTPPIEYLPTPPLDVADLSPVSSSSSSPIAVNSLSSPYSNAHHHHVEHPLKAGDILFWHHLMRHGEIPGVSDDPRARKGYSTTRKSMIFGR
ncbi:hypothetical protein BT96DRAFT_961284 [Gymnopus androsaceus JB14]|uniref:Uncharacterized protein n=1 Tax=Gymnopus androsaceus JB14 TaxID=1447944 RepID=A0A6A4IG78_9AGAR|nr:hypothetical protein BT96DRAFT_961284 [Gymnopus androsaceus JB14]